MERMAAAGQALRPLPFSCGGPGETCIAAACCSDPTLSSGKASFTAAMQCTCLVPSKPSVHLHLNNQ